MTDDVYCDLSWRRLRSDLPLIRTVPNRSCGKVNSGATTTLAKVVLEDSLDVILIGVLKYNKMPNYS